MVNLTPYRVHCFACESENIGPDRCNDCGYRPNCVECFDTRSVPAPDLHVSAMGTCGDCT